MKRQNFLNRTRIGIAGLLAAAVAVTAARTSMAATWSVTPSNANWSTPLNWDIAPVAGDPLNFGPSSITSLNNDLASGFAVGGVTFLSDAGAYSLSGNAITLTGDLLNNSTNLQAVNFSILSSIDQTFNTGAAGITLGGTFSGTAALTKLGTGALSFTNAGSSSTATLNINEGTLNHSAGSITATGGSVRVGNAGGTATYNLANGTLTLVAAVNGNAVVVGTGGGNGTLNVGGTGASAGLLNIQGGEVLIGEGGGGAVNLSGDAKMTLSQGSVSFNGLFLGRFGGSGSVTLTDNASFSSTRVGGVFVVGGGWAANAGGPGQGTLLMSGNSTLTNSGDLRVGVGLTTGDGSNGSVTLNDNAVITLTGRFLVGEGNSGATTGVAGSATAVFNGNSKLTATNEVWIGQGATSANNSVTLNDTASLSGNGWFVVGRDGGVGTLTLNGGTVTKTGGGNFILGSLGGKGTANLNNGTILNNSDLILGENPGAEATFNLNGGLVQARAVTRNNTPTSSILNFNGGTLQAIGESGNFINDLITVTVKTGGARIHTNGFNVSVNAVLSSDFSIPFPGLDGGLTKLGSGKLTLTNSNSYTGPTNITAGALALGGTGSINNSSGININGGKLVANSSTQVTTTVTLTNGTLDGTGMLGTVNVANNAANIISNGDGGTAPLTINTLTFSGAATLNLNVASTFAVLAVGDLATNAAGPITINAAAPSWTPGEYNLISYANLTGAGFSAFTKGLIVGLSPRQTANLGNVSNNITLTITGDNPIWTGALNGVWTSAVQADPKNWNLQTQGTPTDYMVGDIVTFDDTATNFNITIPTADVTPTSVIFNNAGMAYTISGAFGIAGTGSVKIMAGGGVTLAAPSTYSGGTTLAAGTLNINHPSAIGTGKLTISGGSIGNTSGGAVTLATNNALELNADLVFQGPDPLDLGSGTITLTGNRTIRVNNGNLSVGTIVGTSVNLAKDGPGTLTLNGNVGTLSQLMIFNGVVEQKANVTVSGLTSVGLWGGSSTLILSNAAKFNSVSGLFIIGDWGGTKGTLIVKDTASITTTGEIWFGSASTGPGTGEVIVNDSGSITSGNWFCIGRDGGVGVLTVNGGTVTKGGTGGNFIVGSLGGSGTVTLNGGTIVTNSNLILGENSSPAAVFNLNGGTVSANAVTQLGAVSIASLNFNGGILRATANSNDFVNPAITMMVQTGGAKIDTNGRTIRINGNLGTDGSPTPGGLTKLGAGTLILNGFNTYGNTTIAAGTLQIGNGEATGNLGTGSITNDGTLAFNRNDEVSIGNLISGTGALSQVGAGTTTLTGAVALTGGASIVAGQLTFAGGVSHAVGAIGGTGKVVVASGSTLTSSGVTSAAWQIDGTHIVRSNGGAAGASKVAGNAFAIAGSTGAWTGKLDLTNNALILTAGSEADQAAAVALAKDQIAAGRSGGTWSGPGITSSTMTSSSFAAANTLAVADAGDLGLTSFRGQAGLDANSTIILVAHNGDATLDGIVDAFDLNKLASSWQQSGKLWSGGDFTGDGLVDAFDLNVLAANWQFSSGGSLAAALAQFPILGGGIAAVPEPASLAVLTLGAVTLLGRRRRR